MKRIVSALLLGVMMVSLMACGKKGTTTETVESTVVEEEGTKDSIAEESIDQKAEPDETTTEEREKETTTAKSASTDLSFDEMKELFVVKGEKSLEIIVEGAFTYQMSDQSYEEIVAQVKEGLKQIDAKATVENDVGQMFSFVGTYGDGKDILISVTGDETCVVSVTYGNVKEGTGARKESVIN